MVGGAVGLNPFRYRMGKSKPGPFSGRRVVPNKIHEQHFDAFFMGKRTSTQKETFHTVSPFLVHKAFTETLEVPSIRKLRSGDLLVEVSNRKQSQQILKLKALATIPITVSAHATLNSSKGVITYGELFHDSVERIAQELKSQGVTNITEKEVVAVKVKEQVTYPEARRIVKARTPTPGTSFASAIKKTLHASCMQTELKNPDLDLLLSSIQNNPNFMKPPFVFPTIIDALNEYDKPHKNFGNTMPSVSNILVSHEPSQQLKLITPSTKNAAKTISALKTDKTSASIASVKKKKNSDKSLKKLKSTGVKHVPPSPQSDGTLSLTT
ncbi:hypothetical protein AVEN_128201-1 [Araneus ventricosus]|uniref:Uncharacterized protein n=1 Tax=Araneus ventricosus TaxID=182803 RepID=A0A4Y1ZZY1_ARAVE|nr:hypothetical protein AVEN_128201-1 [Araneus ventricosus]